MMTRPIDGIVVDVRNLFFDISHGGSLDSRDVGLGDVVSHVYRFDKLVELILIDHDAALAIFGYPNSHGVDGDFAFFEVDRGTHLAIVIGSGIGYFGGHIGIFVILAASEDTVIPIIGLPGEGIAKPHFTGCAIDGSAQVHAIAILVGLQNVVNIDVIARDGDVGRT